MIISTLFLLLLFTSALSQNDLESCTQCGMCYNAGGNIRCLAEYSPTCDAWFASYDCAPGAKCTATNDLAYGRPCATGQEDFFCCNPEEIPTAAPSGVDDKIPETTWGRGQSELLPKHEWIVLDHGAGQSFGMGVATSDEFVYVAGTMLDQLDMKNPTMETIVSAKSEKLTSADRDVFLSKIRKDGTPEAIFLYPGEGSEGPVRLKATDDGKHVIMAGYFRGTIDFGGTLLKYEGGNTLADGTDCGRRCPNDGFVAKLNADDGSVVWARQVEHNNDASSNVQGMTVLGNGNVIIAGEKYGIGYVGSLRNRDGGKVWDKLFDPSVSIFNDVVTGPNDNWIVAVGSMSGKADFGGQVGLLETAYDQKEALVIALDPLNGEALWAALISSEDQGSQSSTNLHCSHDDDNIYVACSGPCTSVRSTSSDGILSVQDSFTGALLKITEDGDPVWLSPLHESPKGLASMKGTDVYVNHHTSRNITYGITEFKVWGSLDQFIVKYDRDTGRGKWVMQQGGEGMEYVRKMGMDKNGDIYTVGLTQSNPSRFDNIVLTEHNSTDGYDVFIAKLATSVETLPDCLCGENEVKSGFCFMQNMCFSKGAVMADGNKCFVSRSSSLNCPQKS